MKDPQKTIKKTHYTIQLLHFYNVSQRNENSIAAYQRYLQVSVYCSTINNGSDVESTQGLISQVSR